MKEEDSQRHGREKEKKIMRAGKEAATINIGASIATTTNTNKTQQHLVMQLLKNRKGRQTIFTFTLFGQSLRR
ncbi:hypothetical protein CHS0354_026516 [Potamilus streckersoni]|uniref:Uncharacterized protein n=1 Tax=Potamilus streckersoni TaxID=2493646 RepID=A0AAE0RQ43_9BIVA|nr:hypothetical protein CHS0354_026516 [Potamilus streckersoni]